MNTVHRLSSMSRWRAFSLHLLASAALIFSFYLFASQVLYPDALFVGAQASEMFKILILVDLVLGPLIMLVIFKPGKPKLKFDVACVLIFQCTFFAFGAWTVYSARPVFLVYAEAQFNMATANQIDPNDLSKAANPLYQQLPKLGPIWLAAETQLSKEQKEDILFAGTAGLGIQHLPQLFTPYANAKTEILTKAKSAKQLTAIAQEDRNRLLAFEEKHPQLKLLFLPMKGKTTYMFVAVDSTTAEVKAIL